MPQINDKLHKAKKLKNDEFYTQLSDIENEIKHYWPQLEGKKIWCNCDDSEWSNFAWFFVNQKYFHDFEVKFTGYKPIPEGKTGYTKKQLDKPLIKRDGIKGDNTKVPSDFHIIETTEVWVDDDGYCKGDFRAKEQEELWEWADVIITNPPFSLFREFIDKIMFYKKQFLVIGNMNAVGYKKTFQLIKDNKMWLGVNSPKEFVNTNNEKKKFGNICWFTNLQNPFRNREVILCDWRDDEFIKYDNADAFETVWLHGQKRSGRASIPFTDKVLGVPRSFLIKYNPDQFEILNIGLGEDGEAIKINNNSPYARIFVKLKTDWYEKNKEYYLG